MKRHDAQAGNVHPAARAFTTGAPHGRTALLVHGFAGTPAYLRGLATYLETLGVGSVAPRLTGHGTTPADLLHVTRYHWRRNVELAAEVAFRRDPRAVLIGFSFGGALLIDYLARHPRRTPAGLILVNTPIRTRTWPPLTRLVRPLSIIKPYERKRWARDPSLVAWYAARGGYLRYPLRAAAEFFTHLRTSVVCHLGAIRTPTLIIQSTQDPVIDPASADILTAGLVHATVERVTLDTNVHVVLSEDKPIHREVYERIGQFLRSQG